MQFVSKQPNINKQTFLKNWNRVLLKSQRFQLQSEIFWMKKEDMVEEGQEISLGSKDKPSWIVVVVQQCCLLSRIISMLPPFCSILLLDNARKVWRKRRKKKLFWPHFDRKGCRRQVSQVVGCPKAEAKQKNAVAPLFQKVFKLTVVLPTILHENLFGFVLYYHIMFKTDWSACYLMLSTREFSRPKTASLMEKVLLESHVKTGER